MITLHIPVDDDGLITFNATLFAIVRVTLKIDIPYNNDNNNNGNNKYFCYWVLVGVGCNTGLRSKLQSVFPNCPKKMLDTVLPERPGKLSLFPSLPPSPHSVLYLMFYSCSPYHQWGIRCSIHSTVLEEVEAPGGKTMWDQASPSENE